MLKPENIKKALSRLEKSTYELDRNYVIYEDKKISWIMLTQEDFNNLIFEVNRLGLDNKKVRALQYGKYQPKNKITLGCHEKNESFI